MGASFASRVKFVPREPIYQTVVAMLLTLLLAAVLVVAYRLRRRPEDRARADLRTIFETAPIGNLLLDGEDRILAANAAVARTLGCAPHELVGRPLDELVDAEDLPLLHIAFAQLRHAVTAELATEVRLLDTVTGTAVAASIHAAMLTGSSGKEPRMLVQALDITERKRVEAQLQHMADHDPLTGLLNRRRFEQELARHVAHARRYGPEGAVLVLDIDHFKLVNDTRGHNAGDRLIVAVSQALRDRLRGTDVIARLGGDEFAILLPKADRVGAEAVARSLVETVRTDLCIEQQAADEPFAPSVTISIGAVMTEACSERTPDGIVAAADVAMYTAKSAGGDSCAFSGTPGPRPFVPTLVA